MTHDNAIATTDTQVHAPKGEIEPRRAKSFATPLVDVLDSEQELLLVADLPGVTKDGVHVRLEDDVLYLEAKHADGAHVFRRSFTVSEKVDAEHIEAELAHGVLTVHIPKAPEARPREIPIRVG